MVTAIEMRALRLNLQLSSKESKDVVQKKRKVAKIFTSMNTKEKYELEYILNKISENVFYGKLELEDYPQKKVAKALKKLGFKVDMPKENKNPFCIYW